MPKYKVPRYHPPFHRLTFGDCACLCSGDGVCRGCSGSARDAVPGFIDDMTVENRTLDMLRDAGPYIGRHRAHEGRGDCA